MIAALVGVARWGILDPATDATGVGLLAVVAVTYGLLSKMRFHLGPWRAAWMCLGAGLMCQVAGELLQALH
ncbi:MAG TPA: hypothetical protein VID75_05585, partial [Acidimicrobiales bacterium]